MNQLKDLIRISTLKIPSPATSSQAERRRISFEPELGLCGRAGRSASALKENQKRNWGNYGWRVILCVDV